MKKVVLKLVLQDEKEKQRAMKKVSGLQGVDSIAVDMKEKKLTVTGEIDTVRLVSKLKKPYCPQIVSVGPAKEEKKEEEKGKDENKKENKDQNNKKKETKGNNVIVPAVPIAEPYRLFYPPQYPMNYQYQYQHPANHPPAQVHPHHYFERSAEEDPNACVIC